MNQNLINLLVAAVVVGVLLFRVSRERKFGMKSLWVFPAVMVALVALDVWFTGVASPLDVGYMFLALMAGTAFGWFQGIHSTIRVDRTAGAAFVKSSPFGMALFVAALAFRLGARYMSGSLSASSSTGAEMTPAVALTTAITLAFAVGLFSGLRLYVKKKYDETPA